MTRTRVEAQLVPDNTLGAEKSVITLINLLNDRIDGGASRGINLFHSFLEFNVGNNRGVYFANPVGIENILTRVTGGNPSNIFGTLGVLGNANLFLMNPNGIYFGPNARLDVSGSFLGTTADEIQLGTQGYFSATDLPGSQLLSVKPEALFSNALRNHQAQINNRGNLAVGGDFTLIADELDLQGQLAAGGNLTLVGANLASSPWNLQTNSQKTPFSQGTIQIRDSATNPFIAAAGGELLLQGNGKVDIFALKHPDSGLYSGGDMVLRSGNPVGGDAHYYSGGSFRIEQLDGSLGDLLSPNDPIFEVAGDFAIAGYLGQSLQILAGGSVTIPGDIVITGAGGAFNNSNVTLSNDTQLSINGTTQPALDIRAGTTGFLGSPTPGMPTRADITLGNIFFSRTSGVIFISNQYLPNLTLPGGNINVGRIFAAHLFFPGNANSVFIDSRGSINLRDRIETYSIPGNAGDVTLLAQGDVTTGFINSAAVVGNGGDVNIKASGRIAVGGIDSVSSSRNGGAIHLTSINGSIDTSAGSLFSFADFSGQNGGDVNLNAYGDIHLGTINTSGGFFGGGGEIRVSSSNGTITIANASMVGDTYGTGRGGNIAIAADTVQVSNSLIASDTLAEGEGGNMTIAAREVTFRNNALVSISTYSTGQAGDLRFDVQQFILEGEAQLGAVTFAEGQGGDLIINASESVEAIGKDSGLFTQVQRNGSGKGGNLTITTARLTLRGGAGVIAGTASDSIGQGGNLTINASEFVEVSGTSADGQSPSGLIAETFGAGDAGNLAIDTRHLIVKDGGIISTSTGIESLGRGGNLRVNASEAIEVVGSSANDRFQSFIGAATTNSRSAGDLTLNTRQLSIRDGGILAVATLGAGQSGNLTVNASESVELRGNSASGSIGLISADTAGTGAAGNLSINTRRLVVRDGNAVSASTFAGGAGGHLTINAVEFIELSGSSANGLSGSAILTGSGAQSASVLPNPLVLDFDINPAKATGQAGTLELNTDRLIVRDGGRVSAATFGPGNSGDVRIAANLVNISSGGQISAATVGAGRGGTVQVRADAIALDGISSNGSPSQLTAFATGTGSAGDLTLRTRQLIVSGGGEVSANTTSSGRAGTLRVDASESIEIFGTAGNLPSRLFFDSTSSGDAGELILATQRLVVRDRGQISAATSGAGQGGILELNASDSIEISGAGGVFFDSRSAGNARGLRMNTGSLVVENGAQVTVSGSGTGRSGDLEVNANSVFLNNQGRLRSTTAASEGGNIKLRVSNSVILRDNSEISAEAFGTANGGNITFEVGGIIFAILSENSDVVANAFEGNGGKITGSATGILGFRQFEKVRTSESDFIASSALGFDGIVDIDQEDRQLPQLPANFLDVEDLNRDVCALQNGKIAGGSSFAITGRGGLPTNPLETIMPLEGVVEWSSWDDEETGSREAGEQGSRFSEQLLEQTNNLYTKPAQPSVRLRDRTPEESDENGHPKEIRPAQGWIIEPDGTVVLTEDVETVTLYPVRPLHPTCRAHGR